LPPGFRRFNVRQAAAQLDGGGVARGEAARAEVGCRRSVQLARHGLQKAGRCLELARRVLKRAGTVT
jgi:hypothetical protein